LALTERMIQYSSFYFLLTAYILVLILKWKKIRSEIVSRLNVLLIVVGIIFWVQLLFSEFDLFMRSGAAISIISIYFMLAAFVIYSQNGNHVEDGRPSFSRLIVLFFFLFILQSSYAFGSANGLFRAMSGSIVFLGAASLYTVHWLEHNSKSKLFTEVASLLMVVSVFVILKSGYDNPYWLKTSISEQVIPETLLLHNSELNVDADVADYISQLKEMATEAGWVRGTGLIDLSGGSPGAVIILGGEFLANPYLIGGSKGSNLYAQKNLAQVPFAELKQAWVLTSSGGRRQLSAEVLTKNGVIFPDNYVMVGKTLAESFWYAQKDEYHILWRPNFE
jgi:hypothetical protein